MLNNEFQISNDRTIIRNAGRSNRSMRLEEKKIRQEEAEREVTVAEDDVISTLR